MKSFRGQKKSIQTMSTVRINRDTGTGWSVIPIQMTPARQAKLEEPAHCKEGVMDGEGNRS